MRGYPAVDRYVPMTADDWSRRTSREIGFWRYWITQHHEEALKSRFLRPDIGIFIKSDCQRPLVANVGSGPANLIGDAWPNCKLTVVSSDLLATFYMALWREAGHGATESGVDLQDMANLSYPDGHFDIVFCSNALDHSPDPFSSIRECVRVCKPGGVVYFRHFRDAGESANYSGLHQWNLLRLPDEDVLVWRYAAKGVRDGNGFRLSECVPGFRNRVKRDVPSEGSRLVSVLRKDKT